MHRSLKHFALILACVVLPALALADAQLTGTGLAIWSHELTPASATTAEPVMRTQGGTTRMLVPAGTSRSFASFVLVASTEGTADCCFVGDTTLDIDGGEVTDPSGPNGTGPGSCFSLQAAGARVDRALWKLREVMDRVGASGRRTGVCPNAVSYRGFALYAVADPGSTCAADFGGGTAVDPAASTVTQSQRQAYEAGAGYPIICEGTHVRLDLEEVPGWSP